MSELLLETMGDKLYRVMKIRHSRENVFNTGSPIMIFFLINSPENITRPVNICLRFKS